MLWWIGWRSSQLLMHLERDLDVARRKHAPGPHWYVPLLGVRPDAQGKGFSRAVFAPVFEMADRDKLPIYLETMTEANVAIYGKLGFELVCRSELHGGLPNWELRRAPR